MVAGPQARAVYFGGRARLVGCPRHGDKRGILMPLEFDGLPFTPRRSFVVTGDAAGTVRGGHAHRSGRQLLLCLHGRIEVLMRWQGLETALVLDPASPGLLFGPGVWCQQRYVAEGSILLVFASEPYDPGSYVEHGS